MDRGRGRRLSIVAAGRCLVTVMVAACSVSVNEGKTARPKTEEVKQQAVEAKPRGAAAPRKEVAPSQAPSPSVEKAKSWRDAADLLPKDEAGQVDWVKALETGVIDPRSGLDPNARERPVVDLDVDLASSRSKLFAVTFPHGAHTQWLRCKNCHSRIFPLRRGKWGAVPAVVTMAKVKAGRYCGACHGSVSFGVKDECARCHARIPAITKWRPSEEPQKPVEKAMTWAEAEKLIPMTDGMPDWGKALTEGVIAPRPGIDPKAAEQPVFPLDVELVPADNPIFKVVFPHGPHTTLLACANCHFGIFQMAAGADPITMDKIYRGEYCGRCHGKVAFAVLTGCPRCHPVLSGQ